MNKAEDEEITDEGLTDQEIRGLSEGERLNCSVFYLSSLPLLS